MPIPCIGTHCPNPLAPYEALSGYTSANKCFIHGSPLDCIFTALMIAPIAGKAVDVLGAAGADAVSAGSDFERAASGVWDMASATKRGMKIEDIYADTVASPGSRLPKNFKTFDFFDRSTGAATSLKSMDPTGMNPAAITSTINRYSRAVASFSSYRLSGTLLNASEIQSRSLVVAIPDTIYSMNQYNALVSAYEYGAARGVSVQFMAVAG